MPPTLAAAIKTACGLVFSIHASTAAWRVRSSSARDSENGTINLRQASKQRRTDHALVPSDPYAFAPEAVDRLDFSHGNSEL